MVNLRNIAVGFLGFCAALTLLLANEFAKNDGSQVSKNLNYSLIVPVFVFIGAMGFVLWESGVFTSKIVLPMYIINVIFVVMLYIVNVYYTSQEDSEKLDTLKMVQRIYYTIIMVLALAVTGVFRNHTRRPSFQQKQFNSALFGMKPKRRKR